MATEWFAVRRISSRQDDYLVSVTHLSSIDLPAQTSPAVKPFRYCEEDRRHWVPTLRAPSQPDENPVILCGTVPRPTKRHAYTGQFREKPLWRTLPRHSASSWSVQATACCFGARAKSAALRSWSRILTGAWPSGSESTSAVSVPGCPTRRKRTVKNARGGWGAGLPVLSFLFGSRLRVLFEVS